MKKLNISCPVIAICILLAAFFLSGCTSSPAERKKLPEALSESSAFEGPYSFGGTRSDQSSYAFSTTDVSLQTTGGSEGFVSVSLADPSNDAMAINLVNSYKPLALPLLTAWATQKKGVILDLCSHTGTESYEARYELKQYGGFSIPVIIKWDQASANRLLTIKSLVMGIPAVDLTRVSGEEPGNGTINN